MSNKPFKVFLSPSNQSKNWCKMGHSEKEHCEALVQKMIPYLEKYGIEYKIRKDGQSM